MIKSIIKFLRCETTITKKCTCGKMDVVKTIMEGKVKKGGWNPPPTTPRPAPPPGRNIKEGEQPTRKE